MKNPSPSLPAEAHATSARTGLQRRIIGIATSTALSLGLGIASLLAQGPVPGDVAITGALQRVFADTSGLMLQVTATAKMPALAATTLVACALTGVALGALYALGPVIALGAALAVDALARTGLFVPRPAPSLVSVLETSTSSGLPSTFGLVYGALFACPWWGRRGGATTWTVRAVTGIILAVGILARVVPGGHWPSQLIASMAFGALLAVGAVMVLERFSSLGTR